MSILPKIRIVHGVDRTANLQRQVAKLTKKIVVVGVPSKKRGGSSNTKRREGTVSNAVLAYVHDKGSPARGIPQREFLRPGVRNAKKPIAAQLAGAAKKVLHGEDAAVEKGLTAVGLIAQASVRKKITTGPFAPLAASTIAGRKRKHPTRKNTSFTPLVDTGQLRNAINFDVRNKK